MLLTLYLSLGSSEWFDDGIDTVRDVHRPEGPETEYVDVID